MDFIILALTASAVSTSAVSGFNERQDKCGQIGISIFISGLIVPLVTGWTFGNGFLKKLYLNDEAGCYSIHLITGISSFIGCLVISERIGKFEPELLNRDKEF